jgi:pimeloyl-ACP methyl ester carboxylesterase
MGSRVPRTTFYLGSLLLACSARAALTSAHEERFQSDALTVARVTLQDAGGPPIRYTLSVPAQEAPLVLMIQGSGCVPNFMGAGTAEAKATIPGWKLIAGQGRYAVMAVDKPWQSDAPQQGPWGAAIGCGDGFIQHFSYDSWLATLKRALRHALSRPEVDGRRVLVIGVSEGAQMAASLARAFPEIRDVALLGGGGPTQLFDFAAVIQASSGSDEEKLKRLQELDDTVSAIRADPASTVKFFMGHPYLRWSSFFAHSEARELAHTPARVYMASGMQDASVPILAAEMLYAELRVQGRDVSFRRIPRASHGLVEDGLPLDGKRKAQKAEYDAIMTWFERGPGGSP